MSRELALRFGSDNHLIGVLGTPETTASHVGAIVLNAGMVHRVGPFRLHVQLTRRLNANGYPTLRMDLSSLGDSGASGLPLTHAEQTVADIGAAMDLLASRAHCKKFVLIGLCAGAANAHLAALADPRVAGAVMIDSFVYRTLGFYLRHYVPRLFRLRKLLRYAHAMPKLLRFAPEPLTFEVTLPQRQQVRRDYAAMLARGMQLEFIFSGGISQYFNHVRQFREIYGAVARHPNVEVHRFRHTDHTYILARDRQLLLDTITQWLRKRFPPPDNA